MGLQECSIMPSLTFKECQGIENGKLFYLWYKNDKLFHFSQKMKVVWLR